MKRFNTPENVAKIKTRVVAEIPAHGRRGSGMYERFWADMVKLPKGHQLEIGVKNARAQAAIGAFLYLRGKTNKKPVGVTFKKKAMYARFR